MRFVIAALLFSGIAPAAWNGNEPYSNQFYANQPSQPIYANPVRVRIGAPNGKPAVGSLGFNPGNSGRPSLPGDYDSLVPDECCAPKCCGPTCCGPSDLSRPIPVAPVSRPPIRPNPTMAINRRPNPTNPIEANRLNRPKVTPINPVRPPPDAPAGGRVIGRRISGSFQVQCQIVGRQVTWFQINMGISFIWDRYTEDLIPRSSLLALPYPIEVTNTKGKAERLMYIAPNQGIEIGDLRVDDLGILISEKSYVPAASTPSLGQIGLGKRSPFSENAVIAKSRQGPMAIAFNSTVYDAYCLDGSIVTPLRLLTTNQDTWETRGGISVGNDERRLVSRTLTIRIESIYDFIQLHDSTFAKLVHELQRYCPLDTYPEFMLARNCACTDLVPFAPTIRYDFSNGGSIVVHPQTYLLPYSHGQNCAALVQRQSDESVLIAGRPYLESAVTVMNTTDHNDPKMSVCQSRF